MGSLCSQGGFALLVAWCKAVAMTIVGKPPSPDLDRLLNLHARENDVYAAHYRAAISHPHLRDVLRLIQEALDCMFEEAGEPQNTDDTRTVSAIAGRVFNTTAGALREAFN